MDILPSGNIFRELQDIHDTGYFSAQPSLEDHWQQVGQVRLVYSVRKNYQSRNGLRYIFPVRA
jgi:krueppel-like factor 6/7